MNGAIYTLHNRLVGHLVGFYGISTLVGYLILNPFYKYIYMRYMICKRIENVGNIFKRIRTHLFTHSSMVSSIAI